MSQPKKEGKSALEEKLLYQKKPIWQELSVKERKNVMTFAEGYKEFIDIVRTERIAIRKIREIALKMGFRKPPANYSAKAGDKLIVEEHEKTIALVVLGERSITDGSRLVASHVDCPRIDLKPRPLYEDTETAFLKTHYYGGIKKYQWVNRPLALVGTVLKKDGKKIDISIGLNPKDPVFIINDLLPHLASKAQSKRTLPEGISGEELNVVISGFPVDDKNAKKKFKLNALKILNEKYGIVEEDLISGELEMVPANKVRDAGLDRAFITAYGHDDRVCSYANLQGILEISNPPETAIAYFADKEEIGSEGVSGAKGGFLRRLVNLLLRYEKQSANYDAHITAFTNMKAISADVTAAFDPNWSAVHDKLNASKIGYGLAVVKYTGSRGKSGASDANAEFIAEVRKIFDKAKVRWQADEMGKVDEGGGGTLAKFLAEYGMQILDAGTPVWGMHSPYETIHKCDLYMTYKGYKAFLNPHSTN
ncbi:MAG: aminopeptidase [Candidatus Ranarchaeia archaeon]